MAQVSVKQTINVLANTVWETISGFDGIDRYLPEVVASCRVEGKGAGANRTCTLQNGMQLSETLESLDEQNRTLVYSIAESEMPFENYRSTVKVQEAQNDCCEVEWSATFEPNGKTEAEVVKMLEGMYTQAIAGLEKLHRQQ
ncbi:MAG: SRPBCC family protein [bacterium]